MLRAVTGQTDDVETRLLQEAGYAFAEQDVILGDDDPHRHLPRPAVFSGISTVRFDSNVKTCAHRVRGLPLHYPARCAQPSRAYLQVAGARMVDRSSRAASQPTALDGQPPASRGLVGAL